MLICINCDDSRWINIEKQLNFSETARIVKPNTLQSTENIFHSTDYILQCILFHFAFNGILS